MAWFEHNGSRIYFEEQGDGDPILLLPGFAGNISELSALRESLAAHYRIIAADLPGSGRSTPQPRHYTATYHEDDARSFGALVGHFEIGPAHILGFSDGGEVALLTGALAPDVVRSIITWGAAGVLNDPDGLLRETMRDVVDNPPPPLRQFRDYLVDFYGEDNARAMSRNHVQAVSDIIANGGELGLARAGDIRCPTLLIAGEHDMFAPPALISALVARIDGAQMIVAEGAGHDVHNARPDWFAQTVLGWLANH